MATVVNDPDNFLKELLTYLQKNWNLFLESRVVLFDSELIRIQDGHLYVETDKQNIWRYRAVVSEHIQKVTASDAQSSLPDTFFVNLMTICLANFPHDFEVCTTEELVDFGRKVGLGYATFLRGARSDLRTLPWLQKINKFTGPFGAVSNAVNDLRMKIARSDFQKNCEAWMDLPNWYQPLLISTMAVSNPEDHCGGVFDNYMRSFKYYESRVKYLVAKR